jgi:hypothetical protein
VLLWCASRYRCTALVYSSGPRPASRGPGALLLLWCTFRCICAFLVFSSGPRPASRGPGALLPPRCPPAGSLPCPCSLAPGLEGQPLPRAPGEESGRDRPSPRALGTCSGVIASACMPGSARDHSTRVYFLHGKAKSAARPGKGRQCQARAWKGPAFPARNKGCSPGLSLPGDKAGASRTAVLDVDKGRGP